MSQYNTNKQYINLPYNTNTPPTNIPDNPPSISKDSSNKYKTLFYKAREAYRSILKDKQRLIKENQDLKDTINRFTCQAECYKHKQAERFKQALDEIERLLKDALDFENFYKCLDIIKKTNEVNNDNKQRKLSKNVKRRTSQSYYK